MPTANRGAFIPLAIACFLAQDYAERELIILDDGTEPISHLIPHDERITYSRLEPKASTGRKRNICCEMAKGEVIAHWDDDDWSAPTRISEQVARLQESGKAMTGFYSMLFHDIAAGRAYKYVHAPNYALGTSQCYLKSWWSEHKFPDKVTGEDSAFCMQAHIDHQLMSVDAGKVMVATIHDGCSSPRAVNTTSFPPVDLSALPEEFLHAIQHHLQPQ
jgi:glycosyltransferase involved in cell wall biosynthesis